MQKKVGATIAIIGAAYLVIIACLASWWYVPILVEVGRQAPADRLQLEGTAFFITWGASGVLGAMVVGLGAALYASGTSRTLLLATGAVLLLLWLMLWGTSSHNAITFGVGGSLILLCFLLFCWDWAKTRRHAGTAADLRLAANICFFIAAWGLCGLLGAPIFVLRPELHSAGAGETMAVKILICLVLGWVLTAVAQRLERREHLKSDG